MDFDQILDAVRNGRMVVVVDERDGSGEICLAATRVAPEAINFMATHARGLVCLALTEEKLRALGIPLVAGEGSARRTFGVSIEAKRGVSTGNLGRRSCDDDPRGGRGEAPRSEDLVMPGHVLPVQVRRGGVLSRPQIPEASVDLARLAGNAADGGHMRDPPRRRRDLPRRGPRGVRRASRSAAGHDRVAGALSSAFRDARHAGRVLADPHPVGEFETIAYRSEVDPYEHVALVRGEVAGDEPVVVRIHSQCLDRRRVRLATMRLR